MKLQDIDFKLWDKKKAKFVDLNQQSIFFLKDHLQIEGKFVLMFPSFICSPVLNADDFDICLCTGFYDKEGNKIYEGDIVELYDTDMYEKRKVVFENAGFVLRHKKAIYGNIPFGNLYQTQKELDNIDSKTLSGIKVIGNIHENPELLE